MTIFKTKTEQKTDEATVSQKEPQYFRSATNIPTLNYRVYYMSKNEIIFYSILAFVAGAFVGYLFYGGLGKDEFGNATLTTYILNALVMILAGAVAVKLFLPMRTEQLRDKRKSQLRNQFRDMLEALSTSLNAGKNVTDSFISVLEDMRVQYSQDAYIVQELEVINSGLLNNMNIEEILADFGARSGVEDISSFARVFEVCYRKGGNIKQVIRNTYDILSDKMAINEDIETVVTGSKNEQYLMLVMPIMMIAMIKSISADFAANFATATGLVSTTIGLVLFVVAYFVGRKVLDIKL